MKIIATYNIKGGVGKTAAAVNLAWFAARDGFRTLVWDLDPQGAATFYFRIKPKVKGGGKIIVEKKSPLTDLIRGTDFEMLDLLPADFSYRHLDILLEGEKKPTRRLRQRLKTLSSDYDLILLDCPPSISLVSEAVFQAADLLLVPIIPTTLSLRTLDQLYKFRRKTELDDLRVLPFFSMADRRKLLHREIMESLTQEHTDMLESFIPYVSDIEKMGLNRAPLGEFAPRSRGSKLFTLSGLKFGPVAIWRVETVAVEIERKFLVKGWEWKPAKPGKLIHQGYLCLDPERSVRIRLVQDQAYLTIKGASEGARRLEFEYPLPCEDARQLLAMCQEGLIEKVRYKIEYSGRIWDVDEFHGLNQGLVLAEVELESEQSRVDLPPWIAEEVTDDPRYFNLYLARNPFSLW